MKWKFRFGAALGNMLEHYDIAIFAAISTYLSAELARLGYDQATEMVWGIFALRYLVRPVGGYVIGRYADRVGKKQALILTYWITGTATLCMALLPIQLLGAYAPICILVIQMTLSFSFAGEYPSLITYLLNGAQAHERSRVSSLAAASSLIGVVVSFGVVLTLERLMSPESMQAVGWRIPLLLGIINIVISFWFRVKLPNQTVIKNNYPPISLNKSLHVFLLSMPSTVTFYTQNIASSLIVEHLNLGRLKGVYVILSSCLLLIVMVVCAWLTDKYSSSLRVFKVGVMSLIVFSIPIYYCMSTAIIELIIISQISMTIYVAMIWCNVSNIIVTVSDGQAATLGVGFNFTAIIVGGTTPLIIGTLAGINLIYIGGGLSLCGLSSFVANLLLKTRVYTG